MKSPFSKQKLTPAEQAIEDAVDMPPKASPELLAAAQAAAKAALVKMRGGKRKGAGRPNRDYIKTSLLLSPKTRAKLEKLSKNEGSLSAAAEKVIAAFK